MKVTIRNVLSLAVAFCILSAITVAFARSSPTLDAYSAGCSAEDGGVIAQMSKVETPEWIKSALIQFIFMSLSIIRHSTALKSLKQMTIPT